MTRDRNQWLKNTSSLFPGGREALAQKSGFHREGDTSFSTSLTHGLASVPVFKKITGQSILNDDFPTDL